MIETSCTGCGRVFEVPDTLAGGFANCPDCGRAVEVPGLRDPLWRLLQIGAALLWAGLSAFSFLRLGAVAGLGVAVGLGLVLWLFSRAL